MKTNPAAASSDTNDERAALVLTLQKTQRRLQELAGPEADPILYPGDQSYLLQEAQEKLQESEATQLQLAETLMTVLNAVPAHIALLDSRGTVISVNEAWQEFASSGISPRSDFGVNHSYRKICEGFWGEGSEEAKTNARGIRQVLKGEAKAFSVEYPLRAESGKRWFSLMATPISKDRLAGAVLMHIDVTARKLAEEALYETNEQLNSVFNAAAIGIATSTPQGVYLQANEAYCQMLGYTQEELRQLSFATLTHPEDLALNLSIRDELLAGRRKNFVMEKRYLKKNGEIVWTRCGVSATHAVGGEIAALIVVAEDITEAKKAEQQLVWKTALLEAQLNSTLDGILIVNLEGKKILLNHRMIDLWNIPPHIASEVENQRQRSWIASQIKDPRPFTRKIDYLYAHPDEISRDELELVDGRFIDRYSAPVHGPDETYYGRIWVYRDITKQKLTEKRMADQVELINMASRVGKLGAWALEYPGPKIVWSEEIYRIHEVDSDFKPAVESALSFYPPASRQKLEAALQTGQPYDLELDFITAKGNKRWVRTTSAIEMKEGKLHRAYGTFQDLTDRKRSESRLNRLVDSNVQSIVFWNTKGEITDANEAFLNLVGYNREDLKAGRINWKTMTPPEFAYLDALALEEIADHQVAKPYEKEFIRKDASRVPVLLGSAAFEDNPNDGVCFILDLTQRKKLEQQFLRAQRMESVGTLAGGIAHDLNNILAPIMMAIDILKLTVTDPQAQDILETIEVSSKRGADIVRQVLSFARGVEGERVEVQPKHLLKDIGTIIRDTFPKNIRQEISLPDDPWTILGDPTQLHQILLNVCVNARDAMPNGGKLTMGVENRVLDEQYAAMNGQVKPGRYVLIRVTDSGTGIPPQDIEKIFEPFFTTKEVGKGTGLGLSTVMAIVKSHDGIVNVYSEPGKGTTFSVYLPALKASSHKVATKSQYVSLPRGNGELILIIDDEASILTITSQTLQAFGYRVLTTTDGADALAIYVRRQDEIAVVLTDMMMPILDGPATIRALVRINPSIKIIAASGLHANGGMTKIPETGVKHFLLKPYTAGTLLTAMKTVLEAA